MDTLLAAVAHHDVCLQLLRSLSHLPPQPLSLASFQAEEELQTLDFPIQPDPKAAPHFSCGCYRANALHSPSIKLAKNRLVVILTGHWANRTEIAGYLQEAGITPEADEELLLAQWIGWHRERTPKLYDALTESCLGIQGFCAIIVLSEEDSSSVYCCSMGPTLYFGCVSDGAFVSNRAGTLRERVSLVTQVGEGEILQLGVSGNTLKTLNGRDVFRDPLPSHSPSGLSPYMLREIRESPYVCAELIARRNSLFAGMADQLANTKRVLLLASGSSHHAALTARYWIEEIAQIPVRVELASEYRYQHGLFLTDTLVVALSQSGETADTIAALKLAQAQGYENNLAITNQPASTLMKLAHQGINMAAGEEIGVTSTKTYIAQLLVLYLLALELGHKDDDEIRQELARLPAELTQVARLQPSLQEWAARLYNQPHMFVIGRLLHLPTAQEGALKIKEVANQHAEAYPAGELKHGPITMLDRQLPVIACLPWDKMAEKLLANLHEVRAKQGQIFVLTDAALAGSDRFHVIRMPTLLPRLNPLLYTMAFQLLACAMATMRGNNVDMPRNISKAVTAE